MAAVIGLAQSSADGGCDMLMGIAKAVGGILALVVLISCVQQARNSGDAPLPERAGDVLRVATYNAHYIVLLRETGAWSKGDWERRKGPMDEAFKAMDADIVGFQEIFDEPALRDVIAECDEKGLEINQISQPSRARNVRSKAALKLGVGRHVMPNCP